MSASTCKIEFCCRLSNCGGTEASWKALMAAQGRWGDQCSEAPQY